MRTPAFLSIVLLLGGCAHRVVSRADLQRVAAPAFIARIEKQAGPHALVFSHDSAYAARLKKLDGAEADRRLVKRLSRGMNRFEVADRLRATTVAQLPRESPWSETVDPARVAEVYQSFLVEEEAVDRPDYSRAKEVGADSIVEFVIQDYGMRSRGGRAGPYIVGYGRMFTLDGRELWWRAFRVDALDAGLPPVDPFEVAKDPSRWRPALQKLLDAVAVQFAKDLSPSGLSQRDERSAEDRDHPAGVPDQGVGKRPVEQDEPLPPGLEDESPSPATNQ
jgi:hypothetical protein